MLVVDGADAAAEDRLDAFRCLVGAARESVVKVIAVTSIDSKQVVLDALSECFDGRVAEHVVPPLGDSEIDDVVGTFSELQRLNADPRSRELLRRLVVVDLLVRGQVSGTPLTDADAMNEVWSGLVRRREMSDRGSRTRARRHYCDLPNWSLARANVLMSSAESIPPPSTGCVATDC